MGLSFQNSSYPHPSCTTAEEYICSKGVTASFAEVVKELCDMPCTTRAFSGPILRRHSSNQTVLTMTYPSSTVKTQAYLLEDLLHLRV